MRKYKQFGVSGDCSAEIFKKLFNENEWNFVTVYTKSDDVFKGCILSADDHALLLSSRNGIAIINYGDISCVFLQTVALPLE